MSSEGVTSIAGGLRKAIVSASIAGLLAAPVWAREGQPVRDVPVVEGAQEPDRFTEQESAQDRRDREQEARDREQEKKDREQEKKDREQERIERMQELYDGGRESLDEGRYQQAEQKFDELARMNSSLADAGLYWKAYAENQSGKRSAALDLCRFPRPAPSLTNLQPGRTLAEFRAAHPWTAPIDTIAAARSGRRPGQDSGSRRALDFHPFRPLPV